MAATSKPELLSLTIKEFAKLEALFDKVPDDLALLKDADDTSIKDVIAHRAHWIGLFLGWYADSRSGRSPEMPARGYKWNQLRAYNADLRKRQKDLGWEDAKAALRDAHQDLMKFTHTRSKAELYGGPMVEGGNAWTTGRWAEAAGPSHYRSAAKYVRARIRSS